MEHDVLIVGSGPVGAAYARLLFEADPSTRVLMVEAGPQLTDTPGRNIRNLPDEASRVRAHQLAAGPAAARSGNVIALNIEGTITAREGTFLVDPDRAITPDADDQRDLPAAAMSSCVGGQGTMWTCATPRPRDSERMTQIDEAEWDEHLTVAERLLAAHAKPYADTPHVRAIQRVLSECFDSELPAGEGVRPLPVAGRPAGDGRVEWTGADTVLGPLLDGATSSFELRPETLCRELLHDGNRVRGAILEHLPSGRRDQVDARAVVVAGNAMRTPQLLWASGIRPRALGHYLTEHPLTFAVVGLDPAIVAGDSASAVVMPTGLDPALAALCLPFSEPAHPFHAQFMHFDTPPFPLPPGSADYPAGFVAMGWGTRKFPRFQDYLEFDPDRLDPYGMPGIHCHYELTDAEHAEIERALVHLRRAVGALGELLPGGEPKLMPAGTSLHYQGTTRVGVRDDGESVCDSYSQVWGFENLFLGGNGLISTATACNPTLTSVALAVRGSARLLKLL